MKTSNDTMSGPLVYRGVMEYECEHGRSRCVVITVVLLIRRKRIEGFGPITFPKTRQHS
jgi:hypothetical protein